VGLDGVASTKQQPAGGWQQAGDGYDVGEGDGKFTVSRGLQRFWDRDAYSIARKMVDPKQVPGGELTEEALSRVDSLSWLASLVVLPIGLVVVGPIAGAIGVRGALLAASGLAALAVVGVLSVRDVRELRRVDKPSSEESAVTSASAKSLSQRA